jgi:hypothetical protein
LGARHGQEGDPPVFDFAADFAGRFREQARRVFADPAPAYEFPPGVRRVFWINDEAYEPAPERRRFFAAEASEPAVVVEAQLAWLIPPSPD